jgi:hypothetical protein
MRGSVCIGKTGMAQAVRAGAGFGGCLGRPGPEGAGVERDWNVWHCSSLVPGRMMFYRSDVPRCKEGRCVGARLAVPAVLHSVVRRVGGDFPVGTRVVGWSLGSADVWRVSGARCARVRTRPSASAAKFARAFASSVVLQDRRVSWASVGLLCWLPRLWQRRCPERWNLPGAIVWHGVNPRGACCDPFNALASGAACMAHCWLLALSDAESFAGTGSSAPVRAPCGAFVPLACDRCARVDPTSTARLGSCDAAVDEGMLPG